MRWWEVREKALYRVGRQVPGEQTEREREREGTPWRVLLSH